MSQNIAGLLRRASKGLEKLYYAVDPDAPTLPQREVLLALRAGGSLPQKTLIKRGAIDRSSLCEMLRRMQSDGLVTQERSTLDTRSIIVTITKDGFKALQKAERALVAAEQVFIRRVPVAQRRLFLAALEAVTQVAKK